MSRTIQLPKNNSIIVPDNISDEQAIAYAREKNPSIFLPDAPPPEPVKPEPGMVSEMWGGDQMILMLIRLGGAFAIWYVLTYGLSGRQKDPVSHGRKVAAWVASSAVVATALTYMMRRESVQFTP